VTGKIRVLVADDEALVRDGLRAIAELEGDIEIVGDAATGDQAVQLASTLHPDVILMDIRMPGMDGLAATRAIMREPSPPRILILTTFDSDETVYQAMKVGASGFLLKDVRRGQLTDAIHAAAAGDTLLAPVITRRLIEQFCRQPPPSDETPAQLTGLTARELEVLRLVGRGQSNTTIASTLFIAETTVKTHIAHILTKLGLADRAQAVVLAYETGLIRPGDASSAPP
jgi:DNA-binding NarL/FixJ family response regulator